ALLTPVLKGVEAEEGQPRHILAGCVDPEHPTRFARRIKWHCGRPSCDPVPGLARGPSVARGTLDPAGALRERPAPGLRNLGERERQVPLDLEPVAACRTEPLERHAALPQVRLKRVLTTRRCLEEHPRGRFPKERDIP